ncbi:transposase [Microbacterium xanthum]|uniref:transposase n=1 Tax=Microbacterium xanthum TaxID=3079794 RepID=UPI002AD39659|nr:MULTISPECIES: transposase [unclassified Microbacterium]MDZ8171594.1 transposase [Microbacterium sp. KSW-48]MDZ8200320.1 transposase [Microbacterium sp. SSW1-59]
MSQDQVDEVAAELYALPPDAFTAARNARAAAVGGEVGARIKELRKPTVAAWAVDLLAREGDLGEALDLAAALREAQDDLDSAELSRLGGQRRQLVAALTAQAVALAEAAGVAVSSAARDDVRRTLNAAVTDAAAAAAVRTARLVRPLEAAGFGGGDSADLAASVGGSVPGAEQAPPRDDLAERRARRAAEKSAREAERAAADAARDEAKLIERRDRARQKLDHVRERLDDLRRDIARLEGDESAAVDALAGLEDRVREAVQASRSATTRAEAARRSLTELS